VIRKFAALLALGAACFAATLCSPFAAAQQGATQDGLIPALLVSDIHFEPFWDPAKTPQLAAASIADWNAILAAPPSSDRAQSFAALQQGCHARGVDTSYPLLVSGLRAMQTHASAPGFITVSGDLISHEFSCKFAAVFPHGSPANRQAFAEKTIQYVLAQLRAAFPHVPVFAALGNNDSGCGDYQLDANSSFLAHLAPSFVADVPAPQRRQARRDFAENGDYSASLPTPIRHARLLVLDDLFMSSRYRTCSDKPDSAPAAAQTAWLNSQLFNARRNHEKIWFMAHIPPGVDPYSTVRAMPDLCGGAKPEMFLSSDSLTDTLSAYSDVLRLALFAHTHMDEMRFLKPGENLVQKTASSQGVAIKLAPSISPVDGNNPSFTVARVDPQSASLADYAVFAASNQTGVHTTWAEEYDFDRAYHAPAFTSATLSNLITGFASDSSAQTPSSQTYLRNYFVGNRSLPLKAFWPQYACALSNLTPDSYRACACHTSR
jgi:sphingomyelin phosphodiesterase acid-like 3